MEYNFVEVIEQIDKMCKRLGQMQRNALFLRLLIYGSAHMRIDGMIIALISREKCQLNLQKKL